MSSLPVEPQGGFRIATGRPAHAKAFRGRAQNIPEEDVYWLWYQHRWIHDDSLKKMYPKSRRIGVTYSTAYGFVRKHARQDCRTDTWVSSRDEPSALELQRYCATFARGMHIGARELGMLVIGEERGREKVSAHVLEFANGKRINSLSGNPDAMASKGGDVALDEFALRLDPQQAYAIAKPTITWGGRLAIISTHRGTRNFFAQLCRGVEEGGNPMGWSYHKTTLADALDQGFLWKLQSQLPDDDPRMEMDEGDYFDAERADSPDDETFQQEFMCRPADDESAFLTMDMIAGCEYPRGEKWEWTIEEAQRAAAGGARLYAGVDVGRRRDLTWFVLLEKVAGSYFTRKSIVLDRMAFSDQESELFPWLALTTRSCMDATGLGMQLAERAQQRIGKYRIEAVTFTGGVKEELAYPVRSAFEDRGIRVPYDAALRSHLRAVRKETTAAGNIRFTAERTEGGHADGFWALALAMHAGRTAPVAMPATVAGGARRGMAAAWRKTRAIFG